MVEWGVGSGEWGLGTGEWGLGTGDWGGSESWIVDRVVDRGSWVLLDDDDDDESGKEVRKLVKEASKQARYIPQIHEFGNPIASNA